MKITNVIALDVGERRVGMAGGNSLARLAHPVATLERRAADFWQQLEKHIQTEGATQLVVGLPRSLEGNMTAQTRATEAFVRELKQHIALPVTMQDEALTSHQAEAELAARGKKFAVSDIDALAAVYILEDYLNNLESAPGVLK